MSENTVYVTIETFNKMREELQHMKSVDRPAASRAIGEAREKGDLKENAEYDSAKEAQGMLEAKIKQLEATIFVIFIGLIFLIEIYAFFCLSNR